MTGKYVVSLMTASFGGAVTLSGCGALFYWMMYQGYTSSAYQSPFAKLVGLKIVGLPKPCPVHALNIYCIHCCRNTVPLPYNDQHGMVWRVEVVATKEIRPFEELVRPNSDSIKSHF
jgi:hypothetical protein